MQSNKFFRRRQFAAPSEDGNVENVEAEEEEDDEIIPEVAFPLPNCYRAAGGFLCCNRFLEELIYRSNTVIQKKQLSECNIHAFASHLQVGFSNKKKIRCIFIKYFKIKHGILILKTSFKKCL